MQSLFNDREEHFEQIIIENKLIVYSVVFSIIKDKHEADDIVQETFIYAYWNYDTLRDKTRLRSWLCAIAKNKAYDYVKKASRTISMAQIDDPISNLTPEEQYIITENKHFIAESIASLSQRLREVVLLFYFAENSIKEISKILAIPEGTVKSRLNASRNKLKKELIELMAEKREIIEKVDIFDRIKRETAKARQAIDERNTLQASKICDPLLETIEDLSKLTIEQLRIVDQLYNAKINSIYYVEKREKTFPFLKKRVEIAELSRDDAWIASAYMDYAADLSNMRRSDEATEYYARALIKAKATGDVNLIANCLYWSGIDGYSQKTSDRGLSFFKDIIAQKDKLLSDASNQFQNATTYTLAVSAAVALEKAGEFGNIHDLQAFHSTCPTLHKTEEGLVMRGQPGFGSGGDYCNDIIFTISRLEPFISENIYAGYTFEQNTFSYSHSPVRSKYEVISFNESVNLNCGVFKQCLHIRYQNFVADEDCELNQETNGLTDIWYAPNVGMVKLVFQPLKGKKYRYELKSYEVTSLSGDLINTYFPLEIGNWWSYEFFDANDMPKSQFAIYNNKYEVVCNVGDYIFIAHSGWGYCE